MVPNGTYHQSTYFDHHHTLSNLIDEVLTRGETVGSRYGSCKEILGGRVEIRSGSLITRQGMNYSLGWMEMLQLIAGVYDPDGLKRVAPKANHELFTYAMAYGPRIYSMASTILNALKIEPQTRQAVLFIGTPEDGPTSNQPCTTSIQFLRRKERLNAIVSMRSWDLCRGLPYDLMMFSGLLNVFARCLLVEPGTVTVTAGSAHIYEEYLNYPETLPKISDTRWKFKDGLFTTWHEARSWAQDNVVSLGPRDTPVGVELY